MSVQSKQLFVPSVGVEKRTSEREEDPPNANDVQNFYESVLSTKSETVKALSERRLRPRKPKKNPNNTLKQQSVFTTTALQRAAQEGNVNFLEQCVQNGVNVDSEDSYGWTPVMIAAYEGQLSCVHALMSLGASTEYRNKAGDTCHSLALKRGHDAIAKMICNKSPECEEEVAQNKSTEVMRETVNREENAVEEGYMCKDCDVFVSATKSKNHKASIVHQLRSKQTSEVATHYGIAENNRGFQMLLDKGWNRNNGLGTEERRGPKFPVKTILKRDRAGIGFLPRNQTIARVTHFKPFDRASVKDIRPRKIRKKAS